MNELRCQAVRLQRMQQQVCEGCSDLALGLVTQGHICISSAVRLQRTRQQVCEAAATWLRAWPHRSAVMSGAPSLLLAAHARCPCSQICQQL